MSTYTQNNKRGFQGRDSGRGRKYERGGRGGRSSFNMVATHGTSELSDVKLKLPPTREQWLTVEQQIRAVAIEKKLLPILEGTYQEKPLFPIIPVKRWKFETEVVPIDPTDPTQGTQVVLKLDANRERVIQIDPITHERIVHAEFLSETCAEDFSTAELVKLHQEKQKNDEKTAKLRAMSWAFLMKLTETHHRDLIIPFSHMTNQPDQCKNAWAAIKSYYEDRRVHLEAM